jgi:hypothetical protein
MKFLRISEINLYNQLVIHKKDNNFGKNNHYNMKKKQILIAAITCLIGFAYPAGSFAQSDLRNDTAFFSSKTNHINFWLQDKGASQIFRFRNFEARKNRLIINLESVYSTQDSTLTALRKFNRILDSLDVNALEKSLLNMLSFELELGKDSLEIVLGSNIKGKKIIVSYENAKGVFYNTERFQGTGLEKNAVGSRDFKPILIPIDEIAIPASSSVIVSNTLMLKDIRKSISDFLKEYYRTKGTFFYDAQLDVLKENSNEFTMEVTKLSKEILTDRNYFENIRIDVKLFKTANEIEIKYQIQGKYSGGFGFAPRRSEYRNMEPDFAEYLRHYEEKIGQRIIHLLTK